MTKSTIRTIALFPLKRPVFGLLSLLCLATVVAWIVTGPGGPSGWRWGWEMRYADESTPENGVMRNADEHSVVSYHRMSDDKLRLEVWGGELDLLWKMEADPLTFDEGDGWGFGTDWLWIDSTEASFRNTPHNSYDMHAPLWLLALLFGAYPLFATYRLYRNRRPPRGHCQSCGYNLTGNVSGRCPECGKPVETASEKP